MFCSDFLEAVVADPVAQTKDLSQQHAHAHADEHASKRRRDLPVLCLVGALIIILIILGFWLRSSFLQYFGFYEYDGYFHYAVIRAAVNNGFVIPTVLGFSGWPVHSVLHEPRGLYWLVLGPFYLLQDFTTYYAVMRYLPIFFGVLGSIAVLLFSRYLSRDKLLAVITMALLAFNIGAIARTIGGVFRGDDFAMFFIVLSLVFILFAMTRKKPWTKALFAVVSGFTLSVANLVWGGGTYGAAAYVLAIIFMLGTYFFTSDRKFEDFSRYMLIGISVWFALVLVYAQAGFIYNEALTNATFLPIYAFLVIAWLAAYYIVEKKLFKSFAPKLILAVFVAIAAVAVIDLLFPSIAYQVFVKNGINTVNSVESVIQELTPTTPLFYWLSNGLETFTTPMSIVAFVETFFAGSWNVFIVIIALVSVVYFFMQQHGSGGFATAVAKIRFEITPVMLIAIALMLVSFYLSMNAYRVVSLMSAPLAILGGYTLYWLFLHLKHRRIGIGRARLRLDILGYALLTLFFAYVLYQSATISFSIGPFATNTNYIEAMNWLRTNTPTNATVLTLWQDGSVVEALGNRTSVTDSVASQKVVKIQAFARWLLNSSFDPQFLTSNLTGSPNYLVVRQPWLALAGSIAESGELNGSYNVTIFPEIQQAGNSSERTIYLYFPNDTSVYAEVNLLYTKNGTTPYAYYVTPEGISYFNQLGFYDQQSGNFSALTTGPVPIPKGQQVTQVSNGQMMVIIYSIVNGTLQVNGGYSVSQDLINTNYMEVLAYCGYYSCPWDNNTVARLQLVYANPDTKIFKINYNNTG